MAEDRRRRTSGETCKGRGYLIAVTVMMDYLYDGTFEGLLTCVYHHYYTDRASGIYRIEEYQPSMLQGFMEVETRQDKWQRVYDAVEKKVSAYALRSAYRAFLTEDPDKEMKILRYLLLGFRTGPGVGSLHGNDIVHEIDVLNKKVGFERERMLQFVRFKVVKAESGREILYASIEPDNDVLELAAEHFAQRFKHDPLIIRDAARNKAVVAYGGCWYVTPLEAGVLPDGSSAVLSENEKEFSSLWKTYFEHIAIKERINPRCQKNHMPARYWKNLTEVCEAELKY
ncbi:MAG: TIGR03915 family putative DNA repair protein [Lentihominibacter sp.]